MWPVCLLPSCCSYTSHISRCGALASVLGTYLLLPSLPNKTAPARGHFHSKYPHLSTPVGPSTENLRGEISSFTSMASCIKTQSITSHLSFGFSTGIWLEIFILVAPDSAAMFLTFRHLSEENQSVTIPLDTQWPSPLALSITTDACSISRCGVCLLYKYHSWVDWQVSLVIEGPWKSRIRGLPLAPISPSVLPKKLLSFEQIKSFWWTLPINSRSVWNGC